VITVPTGKVRFYNADKGFGFLTSEEGEDVYVHASVLPAGVEALRTGSRVEFGVVDGKKGKQALSVVILEQPPSVVKAQRKPADDMAVIVETLIALLDDTGNDLRRGRYPKDDKARKVAQVLRAVADDLDV
jgi:CspA family cold shock protein